MGLENNHLWEFGGLRFESDRQQLVLGDEVKNLPPKVSALLLAFVRSEGRVLKKDELLAKLWPGSMVEESNLSQTVFLLRKVFKECDIEEILIEAIPKIGYRFLPEVRSVSVAPEPEPELAEPELAEILPPPAAPVAPWWRARMSRRSWQLVVGVVVLALVSVLAARSLSWRSRGPVVASVAVLPFVEMNGDKADQSLSLGLADLLISRLGAANVIEVRPTAAILRYLEKNQDALAAGRELGVEAILTGRLYRQGDTLRVTCQLVRVSDASTIWTGAFEQPMANLFTLEDAMAMQTAAALAVPLPAITPPGINPQGTQNLAAYQLYLKGRYFWNKRSWEWKMKAAESFEQAIQLDPNFAAAYAGLADCYSLQNRQMTRQERLAKALPAIERALQLNEYQSDAHASLGFTRYKLQSDWTGAEAAFKRAIELNPNYATAWHWYGEYLSLTGRNEDALRAIQQAEKLDPLSLPIKADVGMVLMRARQYDLALAKLQETLTLDPQFNGARFGITLAYLLQGRSEEAVRANQADLRGKNTEPEIMATLQQHLEQGGHQAYWQKLMELAEAQKLNAGIRLLTLLRLRAGDTEGALTALETALAKDNDARTLIRSSPEFDALRNHPRFQELLRDAGFKG
ncbi:MAG: winged helix-turn-helix domain-containing tetratricopeptide repeat protein [Blastocatellia bacterium]